VPLVSRTRRVTNSSHYHQRFVRHEITMAGP